MNYGKKGSKKRQAELTSKGIMYGKKMRVIFCKVLLVCCFAVEMCIRDRLCYYLHKFQHVHCNIQYLPAVPQISLLHIRHFSVHWKNVED